MMKNLLSSLVVCIVITSTVQAQISNTYQFSYYNGTFTPITGGTAVSYVYNGAANADDGYATVPIGFTFNYDGTNYTNIIVDANGFATFAASIPNNTDTWGNGLGAVTPPAGYTAVPRPIL